MKDSSMNDVKRIMAKELGIDPNSIDERQAVRYAAKRLTDAGSEIDRIQEWLGTEVSMSLMHTNMEHVKAGRASINDIVSSVQNVKTAISMLDTLKHLMKAMAEDASKED